jgi:hypothetical protein
MVDEGFQVRVQSNHLVVEHVPYLTCSGQVRYGALAEPLTFAGEDLQPPADHVVWFQGEAPCGTDRAQLDVINHPERKELFPGFVVDFMLSKKPPAGYPDHHSKMTAYVAMLMGPAKVVASQVTANTFAKAPDLGDDSPFAYRDSASARAGITDLNARFTGQKVAIVGLGGTGSYILDLVAKTEVAEVHLFDADEFINHNAFRAPGAASLATVSSRPKKVDHFASMYTQMREGVIPHAIFLNGPATEVELGTMDFVFLAADHSSEIADVGAQLRRHGVPFVDVGIGIQQVAGRLAGAVRVTLVTSSTAESISVPTEAGGDEYASNIQVAEVNALNAAWAVLRWKRHLGIYADMVGEDQAVYSISSNAIANAVKP